MVCQDLTERSFLCCLWDLECMTLVEEAWCSSEYRFAVISNQYLDRNKFHIVLESKILNGDDGTSENVFGLSPADMKSRHVEFYDMCRCVQEWEDSCIRRLDQINATGDSRDASDLRLV